MLLALVREPAAGQFGPAWVDRPATFLDMNNLSVFIHHKRGAVRHTGLRNKDAVFHGDLALRGIAQHRNGEVELGGKLFLGKRIVGADSKNLGFLSFKFSDTSLVRQKLLRSTRGECSRVKRQHDKRFSSEAG